MLIVASLLAKIKKAILVWVKLASGEISRSTSDSCGMNYPQRNRALFARIQAFDT
jgi:hypothetical protein